MNNKKELFLNVYEQIEDKHFEEMEEIIKKDSNMTSIHVNLRLYDPNNYLNDNDGFFLPFGAEYFPDGVYEALSKSTDKDDFLLFRNFYIWSPMFEMDKFLNRCEQIKEVHFSYIGGNLTIKKRTADEPWLNVESFTLNRVGSFLQIKKYIPFFLEEVTTLKEYHFHNKSYQALTEKIVKTNLELETFYTPWDAVSKEVLSKPYKNFLVDEKYAKKYTKLEGELSEVKDDEKFILMRLFLMEQEPDFKPKAETLLAFLKTGLASVRKRALNTFETYYPSSVKSLDNLNICLLGSLQAYKTVQIKEMLAEKNAKLSTKITEKTELLVLGLKPKIDELPTTVPIMSAIAFEQMLSSSENRTLAKSDNENIAKKLEKLLFSADENNVNIAFLLMQEGGVPSETLTLLCGLFKVHESKKIREEAKKLIVLHGGKIGEEFLAICGRRNYISMEDDEKPKKDLLLLEKVEGFDVESFAYVLAEKKNIAKFYFYSKESELAKKCIVNHINKRRYWLKFKGKVSSHFALADNITHLYTDNYSDVFEKMTWLKEVHIEAKKETIVISKESASRLTHLKELVIKAKHIVIEGSLSIENIELEASKIKSLAVLEALNFLSLKTKELNVKELKSNNKLEMLHIKKINEDVMVSGSLKELNSDDCKFSSAVYAKFFLSSLKTIVIHLDKNFLIDESLNELDAESITIVAKSITIKGEGSRLKSKQSTLQTSSLICNKQWMHKLEELEVVYCLNLENLLNNTLTKLTIRYDYSYDYYKGTSTVFLIPRYLKDYPKLNALELEDYNGSKNIITFESLDEIRNIKEFKIKDLSIECSGKMPLSKLEYLGVEDVTMSEKTKESFMVASLKKINYSEYEGIFDFDVSNLKNLHEIEIYGDGVKDVVYPIKKLTISHAEIELYKAKNFPNLEIFNQKHIRSKDFSALIEFKNLKVLETMPSSSNYELKDIEKLQNLETVKIYENSISYGEHEKFFLPAFIEPLKIKKLELKMLYLKLNDLSHKYFSNLEELVLDDVLVSDFSIFNISSLKKVTVLNKPSVNCPKNWLEELKKTFENVEIEYKSMDK